MTALKVRIKELNPMRMASVRVISANPELDAWRKLKEWAESKGLLRDPKSHPVFGNTCQPPHKNETEYGYEFWISIDAETEVSGDIAEQTFVGGLYAVITHQGPPNPEAWKSLWTGSRRVPTNGERPTNSRALGIRLRRSKT
jgi:DNA gyrase inhibitor GyrI